MGLLAKNGAGGRLKTHKINIGNHMFILGLPGNLSRDWPVNTINHHIDLNSNMTFSSNNFAEITELRWDYRASLWKNLCEKAGTLTLDIIVSKIPDNNICNDIRKLETYVKNECLKFNNSENEITLVQQNYKIININNTDWLYYIQLPINKSLSGMTYFYLTPIDDLHFIMTKFEIGFAGNTPERFPKEYKQSMNDMKRIVNSFQFVDSTNHTGGDPLPA